MSELTTCDNCDRDYPFQELVELDNGDLFCPSCNGMWEDGKPITLRAAAFDALEWLEYLKGKVRLNVENENRLKKCIQSLKNHIVDANKKEPNHA